MRKGGGRTPVPKTSLGVPKNFYHSCPSRQALPSSSEAPRATSRSVEREQGSEPPAGQRGAREELQVQHTLSPMRERPLSSYVTVGGQKYEADIFAGACDSRDPPSHLRSGATHRHLKRR